VEGKNTMDPEVKRRKMEERKITKKGWGGVDWCGC
jgi:hypothetical protein